MNKLLSVLLATTIVASAHVTPAPRDEAPEMRACTVTDLDAVPTSEQEVQRHRRFDVPVLRYRKGTRPENAWGSAIRMRVEADGRIACATVDLDHAEVSTAMTPERQALLDWLSSQRFRPFEREGRAVAAIIVVDLREADLPTVRRPMPIVAPERAHIRLERSSCYGTCPDYTVDVWGDGRVRYEGQRYVDVPGVHEYRIAPAQAAALLARARAIDFWSMEPVYRAAATDNPTTVVRIDLGGQSHSVVDYVGEEAGMPPEMAAFEDEIERVTQAAAFVRLGLPAVAVLAKSGFVFDSPAGATLLADATAGWGGRDELAMMQLVELGAPLAGAPRSEGLARFLHAHTGVLLEDALLHQHARLADLLIARGALETNGRLDVAKRDAALVAAVRGGLLAPVQRLWNSGPRAPTATFEDTSEPPRVTRAPLVLAIERQYWNKDGPWEGTAIAQWLIAQGADVRGRRANGQTLLHVAVDSEDIAFVRFVLTLGLDPNAKDARKLRPIDYTSDEEIMLLLLDAGTQVTPSLAERAKQDQPRVLAWLQRHDKAGTR